MKTLLLAAFCMLAAGLVKAEDQKGAPAASLPLSEGKTPVPVETVKVTDQAEQPLFERIRETYIRVEKKGLLATVTSPAAMAR